ncbi:hypothetical protein [Nonomuraea sp. NPDC003709]|uniref:hypothetical protein n=1 Tax=Nonomuraea sp. NPDC003709 TaxID=3154450 RepID=UPI0033AA3676
MDVRSRPWDPIALLLGISVVLARAADLAERGNPTALDLADIACAAAGQRLDGLWSQLAADTGRPGADPAALGDTWLRSTDLDFLITGNGGLYSVWSRS